LNRPNFRPLLPPTVAYATWFLSAQEHPQGDLDRKVVKTKKSEEDFEKDGMQRTSRTELMLM
jgi:hypothetical protein